MQKKLLLVIIPYLLIVNGCATAPPYIKSSLPPAGAGIYHKVEKGQTLWRISKMYDMDLEELARINHIQDATSIEIGQSIFIPNRNKAASQAIKYSNEDFIWPLKGKVIASFGQTFNNMVNKGINIQPHSNLDVVACQSGKVVFYSDNLENFGKTLIIDHSAGFSSVYARNSQVLAKVGDNVSKGSVVAKAGSAGRDKNIYLHFEIRKGHISQNPYYYLP